MAIVDDLIETGYLKTPRIIKAFRSVERIHFLPEGVKEAAEVNQALPIGQGQTNSQPLVVAFMLEQLQPDLGHVVLDVGFGSGWVAAILAEIVGETGRVLAVEIIPELFHFGRRNVTFKGYTNVEFRCGDWYKVVKQEERFDRIHVACAADVVPLKLKQALNNGGRMVIPVEHDRWGDHAIRVVVKDEEGNMKETDYPGYKFVEMK